MNAVINIPLISEKTKQTKKPKNIIRHTQKQGNMAPTHESKKQLSLRGPDVGLTRQ